MDAYWLDNPELYQLIQQKREQEAAANDAACHDIKVTDNAGSGSADIPTPLMGPLRDAALREKIRVSHNKIREYVLEMNAGITPRTQAHNRKCNFQSIEDEHDFRSDLVAAQLNAWRSMLPQLLRRFAKIPDPRRAKSVKHKITVLMIFGLLAFIFRLSSRREMNRELTSPLIFEHLHKLFPEIDSIPHADTLARLLEDINPKQIEAVHISLIKDLIRKKKFKKLLIQGCVPITIDGTQKLYRNGLLQDSRWCERSVGNPEAERKQQYIYTIEANITLKNGLSIPLMTEYLQRENNQLLQDHGKQDSETTAFERLATRVKKYFPRLKIILFMDAMFATQSVMGIIHDKHWQFIIRLPKRKLTDFARRLNKTKKLSFSIPDQLYYRRRKQEFFWQNNITYGYEWQLNIHLAGCLERYFDVDNKTGAIIERFSEHAWISSIRVNIDNVHELFNLGARKKELIEDSINTEKNRGYHYKHAFSYNWNAMQGFHYLMRLAHAINAISQFTKTLKRYIKDLGVGATLKFIKDTLFSPWLSVGWYEQQAILTPQLRLRLE